MATIIIPHTPLSVRDYCNGDDAAMQCFHRNNPEVGQGILIPGRVYCGADYQVAPHERAIPAPLNALPLEARLAMAQVVYEYGDDSLVLADFVAAQQAAAEAAYHRTDANLGYASHANTFAGAGAAVYGARASGFREALLHYHEVLDSLFNHTRVGRGASKARGAMRRDVRAAFDLLNDRFHHELKRLNAPSNSPLSSSRQGIIIAERRRTQYSKIEVTNSYDQSRMARLAGAARVAGPGLIALDLSLRVATVHNERASGGDWQREAVVQSAGFGAATGTGVLVGLGAKAALVSAKIGLMATPVGWVAVIGTAAVVGYGLATGMDKGSQFVTGRLWDRLRGQ